MELKVKSLFALAIAIPSLILAQSGGGGGTNPTLEPGGSVTTLTNSLNGVYVSKANSDTKTNDLTMVNGSITNANQITLNITNNFVTISTTNGDNGASGLVAYGPSGNFGAFVLLNESQNLSLGTASNNGAVFYGYGLKQGNSNAAGAINPNGRVFGWIIEGNYISGDGTNSYEYYNVCRRILSGTPTLVRHNFVFLNGRLGSNGALEQSFNFGQGYVGNDSAGQFLLGNDSNGDAQLTLSMHGNSLWNFSKFGGDVLMTWKANTAVEFLGYNYAKHGMAIGGVFTNNGNYTAVEKLQNPMIFAGGNTITLNSGSHSAFGAPQLRYVIDRYGTASTVASNITVQVASSGTINGQASDVIDSNYGYRVYAGFGNSNAYRIIARDYPVTKVRQETDVKINVKQWHGTVLVAGGAGQSVVNPINADGTPFFNNMYTILPVVEEATATAGSGYEWKILSRGVNNTNIVLLITTGGAHAADGVTNKVMIIGD